MSICEFLNSLWIWVTVTHLSPAHVLVRCLVHRAGSNHHKSATFPQGKMEPPHFGCDASPGIRGPWTMGLVGPVDLGHHQVLVDQDVLLVLYRIINHEWYNLFAGLTYHINRQTDMCISPCGPCGPGSPLAPGWPGYPGSPSSPFGPEKPVIPEGNNLVFKYTVCAD